MSQAIVLNCLEILKSVGANFTVVYEGVSYSNAKVRPAAIREPIPKQETVKRPPAFVWEDEIFAPMDRFLTTDEELVFTVDREYEPRKLQSFRTAVINQARKRWGMDGFEVRYDRTDSTITVTRK